MPIYYRELIPVIKRSAANCLLGLWVRIQPEAWLSVSCEYCVLSDGGLCVRPITHTGDSYQLRCVLVRDLGISMMRPGFDCCTKKKKYYWELTSRYIVLSGSKVALTRWQVILRWGNAWKKCASVGGWYTSLSRWWMVWACDSIMAACTTRAAVRDRLHHAAWCPLCLHLDCCNNRQIRIHQKINFQCTYTELNLKSNPDIWQN
jgi:hypothetical protein